MIDKLKLILHGDVPLDLFAKAIRSFDALLTSLTSEVAGDTPIEWKIDQLLASSAIVQVRGLSEDFDAVEETVRAYSAIGEALHRQDPIPFSGDVGRYAYELTRLINGHISAVSFVTDANTYDVQAPTTADDAERAARWNVSWGTLRGEVGAITSRPHLQFTLYDALFDKAVACFLSSDSEPIAREIWRKQVEVTGRIYRRLDDDRPVRVRSVVDVLVLNAPAGDFRRARGAIPWHPGDELPEVLIRRERDAA